METIDGLTREQVKYNIYAFKRDMRIFASKRDRARTDHMKAKWERKYANAKGYLENNQERLARFEAVEQNAHADGACPHANTINPLGRVFCPDCNSLVPAPQVA